MSGSPLKPSHASQRRGKNSFLIELNDGLVVRLKKMEMLQMLMNGYLTTPMLATLTRFEDLQKRLGVGDEKAKNDVAQEFLEFKEKDVMIEMLQKYACEHVIEPTIVMDDDGHPDHLPVKELEISELFAIFNAMPGRQPEVRATLEEFRRAEQEATGNDVPHGEDVQPEAVLVDLSPERDVITR